LYSLLGNHTQAEQLFQQAIAILSLALGEQDIYVAIYRNNLAALYRSMGRYTAAEALYLQVLDIFRQNFGQEDEKVATVLNNLGLLYQLMGRYTQAEPLHKQALAICRRTLGEEHQNFGTYLNTLARLYQLKGQYTEAKKLFEQALDIRRTSLGENHPNVAISLTSLAGIYQVMGRYAQAEALMQQALNIYRQNFGENHPEIALALNNLSVLYADMGNYPVAEEYLQQTVEIYRHNFGENHPIFATAVDNLARLYTQMGQYSTAKPLFEQALEIQRRTLGDNHPELANTLNHLAMLYQEMGDDNAIKTAISLYYQLLELNEHIGNVRGKAETLYQLASLYLQQGNNTQGINYYQQSLGIVREIGHETAYQAFVSAFQMLLLKTSVVYEVSMVTSPEAVIVGGEIEVSINMKPVKITEDNGYVILIPRNEAIGNELNIILTAPGFQFEGNNTDNLPLDLDTGEITQTARFCLTALRSGTTTITAELYEGETVKTTLEAQVQVAELDDTSFTSKPITTQPRPISQPDFILCVQTIWYATNSTCKFQYQLKSFLFPSVFSENNIYTLGSLSSSWIEQVQGLLATTLENMSGSLPEEGKSHLISLGQYLFQQLFPIELQSDFRSLIPQNPTFTLLILANQDAWIPWELLHDGQRFLGDRFIIGRKQCK
jgi:tetratricopeptide (TPR) repeat protein